MEEAQKWMRSMRNSPQPASSSPGKQWRSPASKGKQSTASFSPRSTLQPKAAHPGGSNSPGLLTRKSLSGAGSETARRRDVNTVASPDTGFRPVSATSPVSSPRKAAELRAELSQLRSDFYRLFASHLELQKQASALAVEAEAGRASEARAAVAESKLALLEQEADGLDGNDDEKEEQQREGAREGQGDGSTAVQQTAAAGAEPGAVPAVGAKEATHAQAPGGHPGPSPPLLHATSEKSRQMFKALYLRAMDAEDDAKASRQRAAKLGAALSECQRDLETSMDRAHGLELQLAEARRQTRDMQAALTAAGVGFGTPSRPASPRSSTSAADDDSDDEGHKADAGAAGPASGQGEQQDNDAKPSLQLSGEHTGLSSEPATGAGSQEGSAGRHNHGLLLSVDSRVASLQAQLRERNRALEDAENRMATLRWKLLKRETEIARTELARSAHGAVSGADGSPAGGMAGSSAQPGSSIAPQGMKSIVLEAARRHKRELAAQTAADAMVRRAGGVGVVPGIGQAEGVPAVLSSATGATAGEETATQGGAADSTGPSVTTIGDHSAQPGPIQEDLSPIAAVPMGESLEFAVVPGHSEASAQARLMLPRLGTSQHVEFESDGGGPL